MHFCWTGAQQSAPYLSHLCPIHADFAALHVLCVRVCELEAPRLLANQSWPGHMASSCNAPISTLHGTAISLLPLITSGLAMKLAREIKLQRRTQLIRAAESSGHMEMVHGPAHCP